MKRALLRRAAETSPAAFRNQLRFTPADPTPMGARLEPWQTADFAALDPAWMKLAGGEVDGGFRRAWIERPRGHSKTSDMAAQIAWILLYGRRRLRGLAAAADRDQAGLIHDFTTRCRCCRV